MTKGPTIGIRRLPHAEGLELPAYASSGAAGADLRAAVSEDLTIPPLGRALVPSGLVFDIPEGFEIQVRPRSGLAARHGVTVLNAPGTVDCDYRGEVMAILVNLSAEPFTVTRGERIAQLVVAPAPQARFAEVESVGETARGAGGFGSTGRA
ncbi:deoxyuridine 5'-triphosphate nucleotidohydrolase [Aureimonas ureilytica]|uniref:Deoxyuridine 5'-triphosphate nucleotidohydrolase n=1 Tax=Aureimonas ureilytica TaxID=401562 RepID=A0A175RTK3_9HYPH|nr:dUTP diphosphatase [Aureimonas ureilytica]KTR07155.1 deoxyuridine 5'-triphosphate nucleotidohydrolase [Aureimonas ureilytica]